MKSLFVFLATLAYVVFLSFFFSLPVMLLWDAVMPSIFSGLHEITWLQAWGLTLLCGILFKNTISNKAS